MKPTSSKFPRGAEWRQWDFHVHTPASFHWKGKRLMQMSEVEIAASMDQLITAMNKAEPAVFVIMDYWTFDGWFALQKRLKQPGAPQLAKKVFPGIELRLVSPTPYRLNAHVVFSDEVTNQQLMDFMGKLEVCLVNRPLSQESLRALAREKLGADLLTSKGFDQATVEADDDIAWLAGSQAAEVSDTSYKEAITKVQKSRAIGFMPWDTNDGLADANWKTHYAFVMSLMKSSPIFETRRQELWEAFVGLRSPANEGWFDAFQAALDNDPRLAVSGSDAHSYADYGVFPNDKATWIKADPTFLGLRQTLKELAKRSYIGKKPPKLEEVDSNKTFYIDQVEIMKEASCSTSEHWLDKCALPLNPDLIAIIGNKGSGKSALADVIALLGNSRQKTHFSFLKKDRFRGKAGEPAKYFRGALVWCDKTRKERNLNDDPPTDSVEMVRYIPQGHFEELCNEHVSGRSDAFERELRAVIFAHLDDAVLLGALDFDQLTAQQEAHFRDKLSVFRRDLRKLNTEISAIEDQLQPNLRRTLEQLLTQTQKQVEEHKKIIPTEVPKPSEQLTPEQQEATAELEKIATSLHDLGQRTIAHSAAATELARKGKAIQNLRERIRLLERAYRQFEDDSVSDFAALGLDATDLVTLAINTAPLDQISSSFPTARKQLDDEIAKDAERKKLLQAEQTKHQARLNAPQLRYQEYLKAFQGWKEKLAQLTGTAQAPETLAGLKARIAQLEQLPQVLAHKRQRRLDLAGEIYDILEEQRVARARLFKPVQDLIQANKLIRDEYKLQFQATLGGSPELIANSLFSLVKQTAGEFRGIDESIAAVKRIADQRGLGTRQGVLAFVTDLNEQVEAAAAVSSGVEQPIGIGGALRKDKSASDVYDLLYGLAFLEPRYSLLFQDTQIEQLSPGQRGALLLIFYLLVDRGRNPIILDQPEENLDNETVVSLLVPVVNEAKKKRQIIMVTHNPNLAVVCDAEQIIHSTFDRKGGCRIAYTSGAIESSKTNVDVVNVLEGTKRAFENRRGKYH